MCRNIKTLANFDPPATQDEIQAASLQFVRKISGFTRPSKRNEPFFDEAVEEVVNSVQTLLQNLEIRSTPGNRDQEKIKARQKLENRNPPYA